MDILAQMGIRYCLAHFQNDYSDIVFKGDTVVLENNYIFNITVLGAVFVGTNNSHEPSQEWIDMIVRYINKGLELGQVDHISQIKLLLS